MAVSLLVPVIETDHVRMEVTVYSIHQLLTTLVIVLVLDMRESTVLLVSNDVYKILTRDQIKWSSLTDIVKIIEDIVYILLILSLSFHSHPLPHFSFALLLLCLHSLYVSYELSLKQLAHVTCTQTVYIDPKQECMMVKGDTTIILPSYYHAFLPKSVPTTCITKMLSPTHHQLNLIYQQAIVPAQFMCVLLFFVVVPTVPPPCASNCDSCDPPGCCIACSSGYYLISTGCTCGKKKSTLILHMQFFTRTIAPCVSARVMYS